jgi:flagellar motor switch protein FliN/FliY
MEEAREFIALWTASLTEVCSQIAGKSCALTCSFETPPSAVAEDLHLLIATSGSMRGEMMLRLSRPSVVSLAQLLLGEPQDGAVEYKPEHQEAALELIRQVTGHVVTAAKPRWGEIQLRTEASAAASWPAAAEGEWSSVEGAACGARIAWQLSAALLASLRIPAALSKAEATQASPVAEGKFELLMDLELDVSLRFGGRRMLLREILELGSGSVVELDRQLEEPADLLLDGKLIARGEVVVVEGNYGLRITEIVSPPATGLTEGR